MHNTIVLAMLAAIVVSPFPVLAESSAGGDGGATSLEIKKTIFAPHHREGYERLVLVFNRLDGNHAQPTVRSAPSSTARDTDVFIDRVSLKGAVPESQLNDKIARSRFFRSISVNSDNPSTGFALRVTTRDPRTSVRAFWLDHSPRLVIDASAGQWTREDASNSAGRLAIERKAPQSNYGQYICFPASAQVGMNVVFQPVTNRQEEIKNVRVNLESASGEDAGTPASDTIVCYPRESQVVATLGFYPGSAADTKANDFTRTSKATAPGTSQPAAAPNESDMQLLPPGASAPGAQAAPLAPLPAAERANASLPPLDTASGRSVPTSPAALLPPLR